MWTFVRNLERSYANLYIYTRCELIDEAGTIIIITLLLFIIIITMGTYVIEGLSMTIIIDDILEQLKYPVGTL